MKVRPATHADFMAFYGRRPSATCRALVAVNAEGKLLAIGGYYLAQGMAVVFTDHRDEMSKRDRVNGARALVDMLKKLMMDVIAVSEIEDAVALKHFGFKPCGPAWRLT